MIFTDPISVGLLGLAMMFLLIILQVPVGISMGVVGVVGTGLIIGFEPALTLLATEPSSAMSSEGLAVIALFLLMGNIAHAGGMSDELYRLAYAFLGHRRGGLIFATIGACAGFGAICGSSVATAATMARIALPQMIERGYEKSLAAGAIASGGTLGMIIPPSVVMILYAILTENSIITLFLAAIIPGILAVVGIYSGIFTVTEAASVGASMALLISIIRSRLTMKSFLASLGDTASNTGLIFVIIIGASVFSYFATLSGLPEATVAWIEALGLPPLGVIALLMVFFLILGSIFDTIAAMVLTLPFVYPLIIGLGYDPIWWGVINIVVIELGMITPPIGINVFVLHGMARDLPLKTIFRGVTPFLLADLARLIALILFPSLSLWLPETLGWL
ncbi:MAG: TRAP transporter large permease [Rhodobacteraceae bacterium]|nr:TRAP transporter large permease [Paracoccaceae bacterium]